MRRQKAGCLTVFFRIALVAAGFAAGVIPGVILLIVVLGSQSED